MLKTKDFNYHLPPELIAQEPLRERVTSRLLVLSRDTGAITHRIMTDLPHLFHPGDRLVFNNTRVLPARLFCKKETGARIELLFTHEIDAGTWRALVKPSRRLKPKAVISCEIDPSVELCLEKIGDNGERIFSLRQGRFTSIEAVLDRYGEMPLPPYIKRRARDEDRTTYQTVYAEKDGAVAAPTAGLHFTRALLRQLSEGGIDISFVTLHVGIGTFRPVKEEDPQNHTMHEEEYTVTGQAAREINQTRHNGGRIIAVGTTVVRVLEQCAAADGLLDENSGTTRLMILPGYRFRVIRGLITNFHLPRSTLLMLVSAFAGREQVLGAYREAIQKEYRFYSYGDAMCIV